MEVTGFDDLLEQKGSAATLSGAAAPSSTGTPIDPTEVSARLSAGLYAQLSEKSDETVVRASERAVIHVGAILGKLGKALNLDDPTAREIVLLFTVWELHMALGHEEAGREYRIKGRDLIVAAYGAFPETERPESGAAVAAITVPKRRAFP